MKKFKSLLLIAGLVSFAACQNELVLDNTENKEQTKRVVRLHATAYAPTKATLTDDYEVNKVFNAGWENGKDYITVDYTGSNYVDAVWDQTVGAFVSNNLENGNNLYAYFPKGADINCFYNFDGSNRVQNGNAYNSDYDLMYSEAFNIEAEATDVTVKMNRATAIQYFHLTADGSAEWANKKIVSATLSVSGESAVIAAENVIVGNDGTLLPESEQTSIKLAFPTETAPTSNDLQLWFNVLPGSVESMTIKVELEDGYSWEMTNNFGGNGYTFEAGKLGYVKGAPTYQQVKKDICYELITSDDDLQDGTYVICAALISDKTILYYLENPKGAKPSFVEFDGEHISIADDNSTIDIIDATNATWTIESVDGGYSITSTAGEYALGTTSANDGLTTQETYLGKPWTIAEDDTYNWSFKFNSTNRYLCVYTLENPRTYTSNTTNANGVFFLYKLYDPRTKLTTPENLSVNSETKAISWNSVPNAGSYDLTIGDNDPINVNTNSYYASTLEDEYYNVVVVAHPSDSKNYKDSDAALLENAKFGTPTLSTPILTSGAIDENSLTVNWTNDSRATAGYSCEIYLDGDIISGKTKSNITNGTVTFDGLAENKTYTIKVKANAVEGSKSYAESGVGEIELTTKAATHIADITEKDKSYTVKNTVVMAVVNSSNFIANDGTGDILVFKSSHGCTVGNKVDIAGNVTEYQGVLEFNQPTLSNKQEGSAPTYPDPVEATSDFVNGYVSNPVTAYVHGIGVLNNTAKTITIGTQVLSLVAVPSPAVADGNVEFTGYVYGYNNEKIKACTLTCDVYVDPSAPRLSISPDPATKTWKYDEIDKYTVTVSAENGDWEISTTSLDWATVVENHEANTIEITPKGSNNSDTDYSATITVSHKADPSLTKDITLKQQKSGAVDPKVYTYTFNSKSWGATVSVDGGTETKANWTSGKDGGQLTANQGIQVTKSGTGANGTSNVSYTNISKVVVKYCTNTSDGVGTIKVQVGSGTEKSFSVTKPAKGTGTTLKDAEFTFSPNETGKVKITAECTTNSVYIYGVTITAE